MYMINDGAVTSHLRLLGGGGGKGFCTLSEGTVSWLSSIEGAPRKYAVSEQQSLSSSTSRHSTPVNGL